MLRRYCRAIYSTANTRVCAITERIAGVFMNLDSARIGDQEPQGPTEGVACTIITVRTIIVDPRTMQFACVVCNK